MNYETYCKRRSNVPVYQKLRELRISRNLTQAEVAEGINCSSSAYNRYENGKRQPPMEVLSALADFYGVSMDYLYGRSPISDAALSDYERDFITKLRKVPDSVKEDTMVYLDIRSNEKKAPK